MSLQDRLADSLEKVHWHGHYFSCLCVFHSNTNTPALLVYPDKYYCKSCGAYGDLTRLERKLHGVISLGTKIQIDAPRILPKWKKWNAKYDNIMEMAIDAHANLLKFKHDRYFFKQRKIEEFIDKGMFGSIEGWLTFPVFNKSGQVVDLVLRAGPSKSKDIKYVLQPIADDVAERLYVPDWDRIAGAQIVFVVYGIIDAWALHSLNYPVITGITGKSLSADLLKPLNKLFVILPDRYEEADAYKLEKELGWRGRTALLDYPEGCKDPDDVRRKFGPKELGKLIKTNQRIKNLL